MNYTVQIFNSYTSRPDMCQCLVAHKRSCITCHEINQAHKLTRVVCESKLHSVVRSSMQPCQGNWVTIGRACIMPRLPTHLVQELNAGTVVYIPHHAFLGYLTSRSALYLPFNPSNAEVTLVQSTRMRKSLKNS